MRYARISSLIVLLGCGRTEGGAVRTEQVQLSVDRQLISAAADPFTVIEPVWWSADIYGSLEDYESSLAPFSREQRLTVAVWWYIAEVNNGGHGQFYDNSTGIVWPDAAAGFEMLGLTQGVQIVRESARRLGGNPSRDRAERQQQLEASDPDFSDLDDRFYELQDAVDLGARILQYMRQHPDPFLFSGTVSRPAQ